MGHTAKVVRVMIASPSDVADIADVVREKIDEWNAIHSVRSHIVLVPADWKTHSWPQTYRKAQPDINAKVLRDADLLVAFFRGGLGTAGGGYKSHTVEEILRHVRAGKPTLVYFPTAPANSDLEAFREQFGKKWRYGSFEDAAKFGTEFMKHLSQVMLNDPNVAPPGEPILAGTDIFDQKGFDRRSILRRAKTELILAGPNLRSWLNDDDVRADIVAILNRKVGPSVDFVIGTYQSLEALQVDGAQHLRQSVIDLVAMQDELSPDTRKKFNVYAHWGAATLSAVVVDPKSEDGVMFFTPRWGYEYNPAARITCLLFRRSNKVLFDTMFTNLNLLRQAANRRLQEMAADPR